MTIPLGTDAITAYRLTMQDDGTVPLAHMMSAWNTIDLPQRHGPAQLPEGMRREQDRVVSDVPHEPLRLTMEELVKESFRLSGMHRAPDADGWHNGSNIARVGDGLGVGRAMAHAGIKGNFMTYLRRHIMFEEQMRGDVVWVRPRSGGPIERLDAIETEVRLPNEDKVRMLPEQPTFGAAYRALARLQRDLVGDGTRVRFHRGEDERNATFRADGMVWVMQDGTPMKRRDPTDPVIHAYRHGDLVDAIIGYVSQSKTGRIFANVGTPIDSEGDHDAFISRLDHKEAADADEALSLLRGRADLDRLFTGVHDHNGMMGQWLSGMKD